MGVLILEKNVDFVSLKSKGVNYFIIFFKK